MQIVQKSILGGLVVLSGAIAVMVGQVVSVGGKIDQLTDATRTAKRMQTLKTTVANSDGDLVEITTEPIDGETVAQHYTRHKAMIDYVKTH